MQKQTFGKIQRETFKHKSRQFQNQFLSQQKFQQYAFLTGSLLKDLIEEEQNDTEDDTNFDSSVLNAVDLKTYIQSIHKQTNFEPECLIIALIYIDRYNLNNGDFVLTWANVHKLLLVCLLLATKFHDEVYYDNKAFEIGGGVNNVKLIELETKVFQTLDFNLFVQETYYFQFLDSIYNAYLPKEQISDQQQL